MVYRTITPVVVGASIFWLVLGAPANAQSLPKASGWGARVLMEPVIMAHGGFTALCNPRAARLAGWGVDQIEKVVQPTEAQRAALDDLRKVSATATELSSAECPRAIPQSTRERLAFLEQRLSALHQAVKIVAASFDAFYALLSEEQKARADAGPRRWRWRS